MSLLEIDVNGFNEAIKSDAPVFVKYFANWCSPCKLMSPIVDKVAEANGGIAFLAVNVDATPELAQRASLSGIPAVIIYKNEKELGRLVGFNSETVIQEFINKHVQQDVKSNLQED